MMRLIAAEFLRLRKRRALFWWSLILSVGVVTTIFTILELQHLIHPLQHGPAGGVDALRGSKEGLAAAASLAAILIGTAAGTQDVSTGVFRDLVATGRSRWELFLARVPGALAFFIPIVTLGYVVIASASIGFAGSLPSGADPASFAAPTTAMVLRGFVWVLAVTSFDLLLAIGFSSLVGSRGVSVGVMIGFQFIAAPILQHVSLLGGFRQVVYTAALEKLNPVPNINGSDGPPVVIHSVVVAIGVILLWSALAIALGGWRTATRDA